MSQNVASDQGLNCLHTGIFIENKMKKYARHPLNLKWTIGKAGEIHQTSECHVIKLISENAFSNIIYSLLTEKQITYILPIFSPKFVVKCAAKILKIGLQINILCKKIIVNREFARARKIIIKN